MIEAFLISGGIILSLVGFLYLFVLWVMFCSKVSNGAFWGFILSFSPLILLLWVGMGLSIYYEGGLY